MSHEINRRHFLRLSAVGGLSALFASGTFAPDQLGITTAYAAGQTTLTPGVTLASSVRETGAGLVRQHLVSADLRQIGLYTNLIYPGLIAARDTVVNLARNSGAIAAINGDFFDEAGTGAPIGAAVSGGKLLKTNQGDAQSDWFYAGVGKDGIGRLTPLTVNLTISAPKINGGTPHPVRYLNTAEVRPHHVGIYNAQWYWTDVPIEIPEAADNLPIRIVTVAGNVVIAIGEAPARGQRVSVPTPPRDGFVLVGRESGNALLANFALGDTVSYSATPNHADFAPDFIVGGRTVLVAGGAILGGLSTRFPSARSALGFSGDGRTLFMLAIDNRAGWSIGATVRETAEALVNVGATDALLLDGGGSTQLAVRQPGTRTIRLVNQPSRGQRPVANAVALFRLPGSGQLRTLLVTTVASLPEALRVFPGLRRPLRAIGTDETGDPVATGTINWASEPADAAPISDDGVLYPVDGPRQVSVSAWTGPVGNSIALEILGQLRYIVAAPAVLETPSGATAHFVVLGGDVDSNAALIDPADIKLSYNGDTLTVTADADGFVLTPLVPEGAFEVLIEVQDVAVTLPVTIGN